MEAEKMLHIAKTSLNMLQTVEDQDQVEVLWIAAITALRGVGHVLAKVDKYSNTILSQKIDDWWIDLNKNKTIDKNRIFFDFIDKERNDTIKVLSIHYDKGMQDILIIEDINEKEAYFVNDVIPQLIYIPMTDGYYEGEDIRELIEMAIEWWEKQIEELKR